MARSQSGLFQIRKSLAGLTTTGGAVEIDLGAYVDPADAQGVEIVQVDFIWTDSSSDLPMDNTVNARATAQLKDNTGGTIVDPDNSHLIASSGITLVANGAGAYHDTDIFPDMLNLSKEGGRIVVNDTLELAAKSSSAISDGRVTAVITLKVVKLTKKDYMALALSTVSEN